MHTLRMAPISILLAGIALILSGCGSSEGFAPATIRVGLDDGFASSGQLESIEVDLVGLRGDAEVGVYRGLTVDDYWREYRRNSDSVTFTFSGQDTSTKSVDRRDAVWSDDWSGVTTVVVLAAMIVDGPPQTGDADKRIEFVPLNKGKWPSSGVEFRIGSNGLRRVTTPKDAS